MELRLFASAMFDIVLEIQNGRGKERDNKQIYVQVINLFLTFLVILSISE